MGIGMFGSPGGEAGEAPNGIQLCPVLDIAFDEERMPVVHEPVVHHPHGGGVGAEGPRERAGLIAHPAPRFRIELVR
jgi:hypothetical protein